MFCQERFRWYGFFDYGDVQSRYNVSNKQNRWDSDYGRWGWAGGDQMGRLNYAAFLQFLRTGERKYFAFAEANARHVHSVDALHTTQYWQRDGWENLQGCVHRHNAQHWADGYVPARGSHSVGAKIYYYLTGSGWAEDVLDETLALAVRGGASELAGPAMQSYICAWERTGDEKYKEMLLERIDRSGITRRATGWTTMMAGAFGMYDAIIEYTQLARDDRFKGLVTEFAAKCLDEEVLKSWTWPGGYFRIYGEALRLNGDENLRNVLEKALAAWVDDMSRCGSGLPRDEWPGRAESTFGWGWTAGATSGLDTDAITLRGLPYALDALQTKEGETK